MVYGNIDEKEWVIRMSNILNNGLVIDIKNPVSIFHVPELIKDTKPEAYTPHVVGLGPYHHFRAQTYYMQKCKLATAFRTREQLKLQEFQEIMNSMNDKLQDIRASYNDHLDLENETLGWMMVIDGLFLLSVMYKPENYQVEETDEKLEDVSVVELRREANSEDVVVLENPIPDQVQLVSSPKNDLVQESYQQFKESGDQLEDSSGAQHPWDANLEESVLLNTIPDEVQVVSCPKNDLEQENNQQDEESNQFEDLKGKKHSLDEILQDVVLLENQIPKIVLEILLSTGTEDGSVQSGVLWYDLIELCTGLSPIELRGNTTPAIQDPRHVLDFLHQLVWLGKETVTPKVRIQTLTEHLITDTHVQIWTSLYTHLSKLNFGSVSLILAIVDKVLKVLDALGISIPRDIFSEKKVVIPSASELSGVGVKFCRIDREGGSIKEIAFKQETELVTLSLPILKMNINSNLSEVVMRNILAYEAEAMPESPKFSRYIELMSRLMQNTADVDLLKKADTNFHIVPEDADSEEVVKLFGSLKEAVGSKGESELDYTIGKVNAYYNSSRKVKIRRLVKRYLFVSWKVLTGIALILVLLLLLLQTFCSVFGCSNIFKSQYLAYLGL